MRNLSLISSWASHIPSANITVTTFDLDENVIYVSSERDALDGEIEVELWKIDQSQGFNKPPVQLLSDGFWFSSPTFWTVYTRTGGQIFSGSCFKRAKCCSDSFAPFFGRDTANLCHYEGRRCCNGLVRGVRRTSMFHLPLHYMHIHFV